MGINDLLTTALMAWLNQVKGDPGLPASCFKVAFQLTQKTNSEMFEQKGELLTWQGRKTIAAAIVMGERTVHDMLRRLADRSHLKIEVGHGPGNSNRYVMILMGQQAAAIKEAVDRRIEEQNRQQAASLKGQSDVANAAVQRRKSGSLPPPNSSSNNFLNKSASAPSSADALGLLGEVLTRRIGPDKFQAWLGKAQFGDATEDGIVTIALPTRFLRDRVDQDFGHDLLACCQQIRPATKRVSVIVAEAA